MKTTTAQLLTATALLTTLALATPTTAHAATHYSFSNDDTIPEGCHFLYSQTRGPDIYECTTKEEDAAAGAAAKKKKSDHEEYLFKKAEELRDDPFWSIESMDARANKEAPLAAARWAECGEFINKLLDLDTNLMPIFKQIKKTELEWKICPGWTLKGSSKTS